MKFRFTIAFLVALPLYAADEMRKLDWMAGDWKGEAVVSTGPRPERVIQTEHVQWKLGGHALLIEGLGKRRLEDGSAGEVVHEALGVASWDGKTKAYRFDAWTARNGYVEAWLEARDDGATWGFDTPQGKIRYIIRRTEKGEWNEVGEYSADGKQYRKFFEMTLQKVK